MSCINQYASRGNIFVMVLFMLLTVGQSNADATIMTDSHFYFYDFSSYSVDRDNSFLWMRWPKLETDITCLAPATSGGIELAIFDMNFMFYPYILDRWITEYDLDYLGVGVTGPYPFTVFHQSGLEPVQWAWGAGQALLDPEHYYQALLIDYANAGTWQFDMPLVALGSQSGIMATPFVSGRETPEPSTIFLLGAGLIGLAGIGRKRFKK
jgi:hypothetical protein